jgi:preprotein translocase subunit SecB
MKAKFSQLQLKDIQIKEFSLEENLQGQNRFNINIDFNPVLIETDKEKFDGLLVKIKINDRARNVKLKVNTEILAIFEFSENISKEKKARMLLYNGLSIIYGFLRGIIFQKCSYLPPKDRIIPSVNLAELIEKTIESKINNS